MAHIVRIEGELTFADDDALEQGFDAFDAVSTRREAGRRSSGSSHTARRGLRENFSAAENVEFWRLVDALRRGASR